MSTDRMELGDLAPVREVVTWLTEWLAADRQRRPADDPVVHTLAVVQRQLSEALARAANPELEVDVAQYAAMQGVSRWAIYKRVRSGTLPARRRGSAIRIPLAQRAA